MATSSPTISVVDVSGNLDITVQSVYLNAAITVVATNILNSQVFSTSGSTDANGKFTTSIVGLVNGTYTIKTVISDTTAGVVQTSVSYTLTDAVGSSTGTYTSGYTTTSSTSTATTLTVENIAGSADGKQPIYSPNDRWCWWELGEIYKGTVGANRYVPKIGDYVKDKTTDATYIVTDIDPSTMIAVLTTVNTTVATETMSTDEILYGVGPGTQSDTYRVYLDTSVTPYIFAVDARLRVGGSMCAYAKLFRGADYSSGATPIAALYDTSGNRLTENIPLELCAVDSHVNHSIRVVSVAYTTVSMTDGELVTCVLYSSKGNIVSKRQLLVENTAFARNVPSSQKYISHIALKSPFLSTANDNQLQVPMNVTVNSINMNGVVYYSDGSSTTLPVDGSKFAMDGMGSFVATIIGQKIPLSFRYELSDGETAYGAVTGDGKKITEAYEILVTQFDGSYSVKLFGFPQWVDDVTGYTLRWFLYNLDRTTWTEVTPYVTFNTNTGSFNPLLFDVMQNRSVSIDLSKVSGSYKPFIHVQTIGFVLKNPSDTSTTTKFNVVFSSGQDTPFGVQTFAKVNFINQNLNIVNLTSGYSNKSDWLQAMFYNTKPLTNTTIEAMVPVPTHFALNLGDGSTPVEFTIDQWNSDLTINRPITALSNVYLHFFKRTSNNDIQLAVAGIPVVPA